jgi:hypothetical protein
MGDIVLAISINRVHQMQIYAVLDSDGYLIINNRLATLALGQALTP